MATVAVIGGGRWGRNLVRNFAALGALRGICDLDHAKARMLAHRNGSVRVYANLEEVVADTELDAVSVAVPAESHYEVAKAALMAGKHCLVEKPLVLQLEHALELKSLAEQQGRILMVGHLLCYHPAVRKLKELMEAGALGEICRLTASRRSFGPIMQVGNVLWDLGVHDVSMVLYLLGQLPESVGARGGSHVTPGVPDAVVAVLDFPNGVQAEISASWIHPFKEQRLMVVGSQAIAVFDDVAPTRKLEVYPSQVKWVQGQPVAEAAEPRAVDFASGEPLREECEHFLTCIADGERPLTDAEEGLRVLRVLTTCQASLDQDGRSKRLDAPDLPV